MRIIQLKALDAGRRVQAFLDTHTALVGQRVTPQFRHHLDDTVSQLVAFQLSQGRTAGTARGETALQHQTRRVLYESYLRPIRRIARRYLRNASGLPHLVVVVGSDRGKFIERATNAADEAAHHEQVLIDHGMPTTFLAEMRANIARLTASVHSRAHHQNLRAEATSALEEMEVQLRGIVDVLDDILTPLLKPEPGLLESWKGARRIHQTPVAPMIELVKEAAPKAA